MGDLKRGRTVRSLCYLMKNYRDVRLVMIAPQQFAIEPDIKAHLREQDITFVEDAPLAKALPDARCDLRHAHAVGVGHGRRNRTGGLREYSITPENLGAMKHDAVIMHPLPRGPEIHPAVDDDPRAVYWRQERNGMWMRVAILLKLFQADGLVRNFDLSALQ